MIDSMIHFLIDGNSAPKAKKIIHKGAHEHTDGNHVLKYTETIRFFGPATNSQVPEPALLAGSALHKALASEPAPHGP